MSVYKRLKRALQAIAASTTDANARAIARDALRAAEPPKEGVEHSRRALDADREAV